MKTPTQTQTRWLAIATVAAAFTLLSGCSALMEALRPDPGADDVEKPAAQSKPTVGGQWSERGFLDDNGSSNGLPNRAPTSMAAPSANNNQGQDSWGNGADNQNPPTQAYANTPNVAPPTKRLYKNGVRATRADFVDESQNEGSLWGSDGQTNYYFTKNKVRSVGDIVTINIEDGLIKDIGTEVKRTLDENEKQAELALAQQRALARAGGADKNKNTDAIATSQAAPTTGAPGAAGVPLAHVNPEDIDVSKSIELKTGDIMMAEITERYPNGNYKISGTKRVIYKNGSPRLVNLVGVVRGSDIGDNDTVASGKLYEYRLEAVR